MTKEELAKKKGLKNAPKHPKNPSETLITKQVADHKLEQREESVKDIKQPAKTGESDGNESVRASNRGRKKGKTFVPEDKLKKSISISVSPEDEELYKEVIAKNPKRFKSMSQLAEQALDYFIKGNNLI